MTTEQMEAMLGLQETYRKMHEVEVSADFKTGPSGKKVRARRLYDKDSKDYNTDVKESIEIEEGLSHAYILQSLADKDINAHVKDNKIIVDKTDATAARSHLKKIGHDHLKVTSKGSGQVAEEVVDEVLDTKKAINAYLDKSAEKRKALTTTSSLDNDNQRKINKSFAGSHKAIDKISHKLKEEELDEKELTPTDIKQKEHIVKGMKKKLQSFKDRYGEKAKGVMYAVATNIAKKMPDVKEELEEARKAESMQVHHPSYSSAVQHARAQVEKKGYEISDEDWFHHVNSGPSKPSEGKTNSLHIPLQKGGKYSKKVAHIQVYNRGNDIPNNHELNMYVN
jgi:hypothetical protein